MTRTDLAVSPGHQAYLKALEAHKQAQAQYHSLKSELDILTQKNAKDASKEYATRKNTAGNLVPLLYQRETLRRLKIIDTAFSGINKDNPVDAVVDDFTKARAGELPPPPSANARPTNNQAVEERTAELNKALLSALHTVKEHSTTHRTANGTTTSSPEAQVYALEQARNALITWIEEKLVVIGEAQAANAKPPETLQVADEEPPIPVSSEEISQIYEQYITTRKSLLHVLQHSTMTSDETSTPLPEPTRSSSTRSGDDISAVAVSLLPFIAPLSTLKDDEVDRAALSSFAEQSLEDAEQQNAHLIRRLADESHLVQPGVKDGATWAVASDAAKTDIARHVASMARDAIKKTSEAQNTLHSMGRLPELLTKTAS